MSPTVKIYGYGWVGQAVHRLFPDAQIHDPEKGIEDWEPADVGFICVPTPLGNDTRSGLDCSIVEDVIRSAAEPLLIIRSTCMPGTADKFSERAIVVQPEYLGETVGHPLTDARAREFLILGGRPECRSAAIELYQRVYNANIRIRQVSAYAAEVIKLSENRAIAFKVAQCQELYDACRAAGIDYHTVREAVYGDDPRFTLWWTFVYPQERGFDSKCIPKDVYGWSAWADSVGADHRVTDAVLEANRALLNLQVRTPA